MKKKIKKIGNSLGITFDKEEQEIYHLQAGEIREIELSILPWTWKEGEE